MDRGLERRRLARQKPVRGQHLSPLWRRTAVMLATLWLVVPALASIHSTEQSHRYCDEHGAFEHGQQQVTNSVETDRVAISSTVATIKSTTTSITAQHEVCAFSASILREATRTRSATLTPSATLADLPQVASRRSQTDALQQALLRISPKSSPPTHNSPSSS